MNLAGRQLTHIKFILDPLDKSLTFRFYSDDTVVETISVAALGQKTVLFLQNNTLTSVPVALFRAAHNVVNMSVFMSSLMPLFSFCTFNIKRVPLVCAFVFFIIIFYEWQCIRSDISNNPLTELHTQSFANMPRQQEVRFVFCR